MEIVSPEKIPQCKKQVLFKEKKFAFPDEEYQPLVHLYKFFQDLKILCEKSNGVGLSAVQVGKPYPIFVAKISNEGVRYRNFINCSYKPVKKAKQFHSVEGCLSLTGPDGFRRFKVPRFNRVKIKGLELVEEDGLKIKEIEFVLSDIDAIIMQHEIDHQNNILISNIGQEIPYAVKQKTR